MHDVCISFIVPNNSTPTFVVFLPYKENAQEDQDDDYIQKDHTAHTNSNTNTNP